MKTTSHIIRFSIIPRRTEQRCVFGRDDLDMGRRCGVCYIPEAMRQPLICEKLRLQLVWYIRRLQCNLISRPLQILFKAAGAVQNERGGNGFIQDPG